jgi:hypothetical protein
LSSEALQKSEKHIILTYDKTAAVLELPALREVVGRALVIGINSDTVLTFFEAVFSVAVRRWT